MESMEGGRRKREGADRIREGMAIQGGCERGEKGIKSHIPNWLEKKGRDTEYSKCYAQQGGDSTVTDLVRLTVRVLAAAAAEATIGSEDGVESVCSVLNAILVRL